MSSLHATVLTRFTARTHIHVCVLDFPDEPAVCVTVAASKRAWCAALLPTHRGCAAAYAYAVYAAVAAAAACEDVGICT